MSRGRATFREADITRLLRAARKAGVDVKVKIERDGTMIVMTAMARSESQTKQEPTNEWDEKYGAA